MIYEVVGSDVLCRAASFLRFSLDDSFVEIIICRSGSIVTLLFVKCNGVGMEGRPFGTWIYQEEEGGVASGSFTETMEYLGPPE